MEIKRGSMGVLWHELLQQLYHRGDAVSPRGVACYEVCGVKLRLTDARANLLVNEHRKLAYRFAVAEWLWIYFGHDDVATIERYNPNIARFSDDGVRFHGAYGTRVYGGPTHGTDQWYQVIELLRRDRDTRQAVITIFGPRDVGANTKDVPCTLSLQFLLRRGRLNAILSMRSSDVWLGLPYDVFTFTMLQNIAAAQLGVELGWFQANLGSSHLYGSNVDDAKLALAAPTGTIVSPVLKEKPPLWLDRVLTTGDVEQARQVSLAWPSSTGWVDPWASYADVLLSSNTGARSVLKGLETGHQDRPGAPLRGPDGSIPDPSADRS